VRIRQDGRKPLLALLGVALVASGCAAPYKLMPSYYDQASKIKHIGVYPLVYMQDGKTERLFGMTFSQVYPERVTHLPMTEGVVLDKPDAVLAALSSTGVTAIDSIVLPSLPGYAFANHPMPSDQVLHALAGSYDGLIVPTLTSYHEVEAGRQIAEEVALSCLFGGAAGGAAEQNSIKLDFVLYSTSTGQPLWTYAYESSGEYGEQRTNYSTRSADAFAMYFPYSPTFKGR